MNYLEKFVIEQNKKLEDNIRKALPMPFDEVKNEIIKAKRAQIGEVREWGGVKMRKETNGWVPVKDGSGKPKAEEAPGKEGGETPSIEEHAKKASEAALQNAIKNSPDPEVRAAAHRELERRNKEEKSEMFQKPVGASGGDTFLTPENNEKNPNDNTETKEQAAERTQRELDKLDKEEKQPDKKIEPKPEPKKEGEKSSKFKEELHDKIFMAIGNVDANSRKLPKINADAIGKVMGNLDSDNPDYAAASELLRTVAVNGGNEVFKEGYLDSVADEIDEELGKKEELTKEEKQPDKKIEPKEVDEMVAKYSEGKATVDEVTEFLKKYDAQKKGVKGVDDNIKKSLSDDLIEKRTTYQFIEGQNTLLQKSHINEFVFNDNFSVAKTGLELKKKFEEQLKMEIEEIRENSRKAAECLKEIGEQPTESFEDEYYWAVDGYEDKIQQLPMVFKSGGEIVDMKYSNQEGTIQNKKFDYNGLARKIVDGMIEIIHLNTLINSMIDGKTYKLNIKQAAILGF